MRIVHEVTGYETSRDYEKLADLMQSQSVICIVDYDECRDVAKTMFEKLQTGRAVWQISTRGTCYIYVWSIDGFMKQCKHLNVEFIIPSKQP